MNKSITHIALAILLLMNVAMAQDELSWDQLSSEQQRVLTPMKDKWGDLSVERRTTLQHGAERWSKLTPDQRKQMRINKKDGNRSNLKNVNS